MMDVALISRAATTISTRAAEGVADKALSQEEVVNGGHENEHQQADEDVEHVVGHVHLRLCRFQLLLFADPTVQGKGKLGEVRCDGHGFR